MAGRSSHDRLAEGRAPPEVAPPQGHVTRPTHVALARDLREAIRAGGDAVTLWATVLGLVRSPRATVPATATLSSLIPGQANSGRAVVLYQVAETNGNTTVLFSSSNFTNSESGGDPLIANSLPYGDKGFIVFRKGGDGSVLQARQVGSTFTNVIGDYAPVAN